MADVTCGECGHMAQIASPSDVWKCNCAVSESDCECDAVNHAPRTEDNAPDVTGEIAELEARLLELRGDVTPEGGTTLREDR